jgi:hypothetical protein
VRIESTRIGKPGILLTLVVFLLSFVTLIIISSSDSINPVLETYAEVFEAHFDSDNEPLADDDYGGYAAINKTVVDMPDSPPVPEIIFRPDAAFEVNDDTAVMRQYIDHMSPENQLLYLTMKFKRPQNISMPEETFEFDQLFYVQVTGGMDTFENWKATRDAEFDKTVVADIKIRKVIFAKGATHSNDIMLLALKSIGYTNFMVDLMLLDARKNLKMASTAGHEGEVAFDDFLVVTTDYTFINDKFTIFEMHWKTTFIVITLVAMFMPRLNRGEACSKSEKFALFSLVFEGFFYKLLTTRKLKDWSHQQKWIGALLVALILFNDPFFRLEVYMTGPIRTVLGIIGIMFKQGFLTLMMVSNHGDQMQECYDGGS